MTQIWVIVFRICLSTIFMAVLPKFGLRMVLENGRLDNNYIAVEDNVGSVVKPRTAGGTAIATFLLLKI